MILYRLQIETEDGPVVFQRWDRVSRVAVAPLIGDCITPLLAGDVIFEVKSRLWEMDTEPGLIVMASVLRDSRLTKGRPETDRVPDGFFEALGNAGWERQP